MTKTLFYCFFMTFLSMIELLGLAKVLKSVAENNFEGQKVKVAKFL